METQGKVLYVRLSPDLHRRFKVAAANRDRSMAQLAREAVERYVEAAEEPNG